MSPVAKEHLLKALLDVRKSDASNLSFEFAFTTGLYCAYFRAGLINAAEMMISADLLQNARTYRAKEIRNASEYS